MSKHVFSTLSADTTYTQWQTMHGKNSILRKVLVRGGAGVATAGGGPKVYTPLGVRTAVSDEEADFLSKHKQFKEHQERGFVKVQNVASDPDTVAQKMEPDAGGAPKTPADVKKEADEAAKKSGLTPTETLQVTTNKGK